MKIVLVRHGETTANHLKLIQGWTDNPLNDLGRKQAIEAGRFLKNINYTADAAYSSPLSRASETGEIMLEQFSTFKEIFYDFHFIERNFGPFEGTSVIDNFEKLLVKGFKSPGFEDDELLINRVKLGLVNLYRYHKDQDVIIFCHSHVIKSCLILADPITYNFKTFVDNGSLHKFSFDGKKVEVLDFSFNENNYS